MLIAISRPGFSEGICIVSHEEDIDGIGSAAIAIRATKSRCVYLVGYFEDKWLSLGRRLRAMCGKRSSLSIVISDLNPSMKIVEILDKSLDGCDNKKITWIDHHVWREDVLSKIRNLGYIEIYIDRSRTASENTSSFFGLDGDPVVKPIKNLSRDTDYGFFKHPLSEPLTDVIRYTLYSENTSEYLLKLALKFSRGVVWDYDLEARWVKAREKKLEAIENARKNSVYTSLKGYRVFISIADPMLSSRIILRETGAEGYDIAFVAYTNGSITISRGRNDINCAEIASRLGGGGHPHIAGAQIDRSIIMGGLDKILEYLGKKL